MSAIGNLNKPGIGTSEAPPYSAPPANNISTINLAKALQQEIKAERKIETPKVPGEQAVPKSEETIARNESPTPKENLANSENAWKGCSCGCCNCG